MNRKQFKELSKIKWKEIDLRTIIHYPGIKKFCSCPYPGHPKGCINLKKCNGLGVPEFKTILEKGNYNYFYLVYLIFDFKRYKESRKKENPEFFNTKGRIKCNRYYQNTLKSFITKYLERLRENNANFYVLGFGSGLNLSFQKKVASMEHACINVFSTMKLNKIKFEVKPVNQILFCNLLLSRKIIQFKNQNKRNLMDYIENLNIKEKAKIKKNEEK